LDLDHIESIFNASTSAVKVDDQDQIKDQLEPLEEFDRLEECSNAKIQKWRSKGLEAIRKGQVCALVLSGGQGTRLGFSGPKGMYSIGLPSHKSLFQLFAERIRKLEQLAGHGSKIHFYLMTSKMNHEETVSFFEQHDYFGLKESQMFFFPQGTLPCFTLEGKLMLQNSYQLATASDGNGGIYHALSKSGALTKLQKQHVKYLHVFSVDNALCKVADPVFIGYCIDKNADCANKVVWKSRPDESVGVVAKKNGKFCIIEYSEMDSDIRKQTDPKTGQLAYGAANICNHFFTT
jgi:UDP-N-acetylglucosamine/UDP-N-acetylgalactosamine diphosphorylase